MAARKHRETLALDTNAPGRRWVLPIGVIVTLGVLASVVAQLTIIGSDALWLPALGDAIRRTGSIPNGIPFAAADSAGWVNTTALGQLLFSYAFTLGSIGIVITQLAAVVLALGTLALSSSTLGARSLATSVSLVVVALGAAAPLLIARAQLLSLLPYAVLLVLLRREQERPTSAIWWTVPLVAIWGNLHGGVLVGVAVLGCYLVFSRLRQSPFTAVGVGLAALTATCLNPGLLDAPHYYLGVFGGEATSDDSGMWSRLSLTNPFDMLLVVGALVLLSLGLRRRRPLWEYVAGVGLAIATVTAARHGIWLLLFLATPAALGWARLGEEPVRARVSPPRQSMAAVALLAVACVLVALRAPTFAATDAEATSLASATRGQVVLVEEPLAESLAAAGATVWVSNPLDAFTASDQAAYLAFMKGDETGARPALERADVVVAKPDSPQARAAIANGFVRATRVAQYVLLRRA